MRKCLICAVVCLLALLGLWIWNDGRQVESAASSPDLSAGATRSITEVTPRVSSAVGGEPKQTPTVRGTLPYVLASETPFDKPMRLAVEATGARVVAVQSARKLLVEADSGQCDRLSRDGRFLPIEEFVPSRKIDSGLSELVAAGAKTVDVTVVTTSPEDRERMLLYVLGNGGEKISGCLLAPDSFKVRIPAALIGALSLHGEVRWMESFVRPEFTNNIAVDPVAMNVRAAWDLHGLSGAGQIITTSDSGISFDEDARQIRHPDLSDQVIGVKVSENCITNDNIGHGTHTAGSIVGDGSMSAKEIRGTAWGAKLFVWFCSDGGRGVYTPDDINELLRPTPDPDDVVYWDQPYSAYIHSASWGTSTPGTYTAECKEFDKYVWEHPDFLPVISAGNEGSAASTIGSPAAAKNVLAVGATQNSRIVPPQGRLQNGNPVVTAEYSSRGPCKDGRIKPDIAAPGTGVLSTRAWGVDYSYGNYNDYYAFDTGTSMACPLVAGSVALVREWLLNQPEFSEDENKRPTAALMKAVITGGASANDTVPDFEQGWGRVNLEETLYPNNRAVKLIDRIKFADRAEFAWAVRTTNAAPLEVQLVWVDHPGEPSAEKALVNDLDLVVERRDEGREAFWLGNGGDEPDVKNNIESVRIAEAEPGTYVVIVDCRSVLYDYLEGGAAALYIRGAFDPATVGPADALVRIRERNLGFQSLKRAVEEVQSGETIELMGKVRIPAKLTIDKSCRIVSSDAGEMRDILRPATGRISLEGDSVRVLFDHVRIVSVEGDGTESLCVLGTATAALKDIAGFGSVLLYSPTGLELCGPLTERLEVNCLATSGDGAQFGVASVSVAELNGTANYLVNRYNDEHVGSAVDSPNGTILVWDGSGETQPDLAVASYADSDGINHYYSTLRQLFVHAQNTGNVVVYRDCELTNAVNLAGPLTLSSSTDRRQITFGKNGAFTVGVDKNLSIANLALAGADNGRRTDHFITVDGGSLVLGDGAIIRNVECYKSSTVFVKNSGRVEMLPGSEITKNICRESKTTLVNNSPGVCLFSPGSALIMTGGRIYDCQSEYYAAGVFVASGAEVQLSGLASVYGNIYNKQESNIYLNGTKAKLVLTGAATGYVGVEFSIGYPAGNKEGGLFGSFTCSSDDAKSSLGVFFYNQAGIGDKSPLVAQISEEGNNLQWAKAPEGPQSVTEAVAEVGVLAPGGAEEKFYLTVAEGFAVATNGATVRLLRDADFVTDFAVTNNAAIVFDGGGYTLFRRADATIRVPENNALALTNIVLSGEYGGTTAMVKVEGGRLTLENGSVISNVSGQGGRACGGVVVWKGVFTMNPGAAIRNCANYYVNEKEGTGCGGGVLLDNSQAYLNGGEIRGCRAYRAGGIFIGNKSRVYVQGDIAILGNSRLSGEASNMVVHDLESRLYLAGDLTGGIGFLEGLGADPDFIGDVDAQYFASAPQERIMEGARRFINDLTGDYGMVVTNATDALLVWSSAVDPDGLYERGDTVYGALEGGADIAVSPPTVAADEFVYNAAAQIGVKEGIGYALYSGVATNAGDYVARAVLRKGFVWTDGTYNEKSIPWKIAKKTIRVVAFEASKKEGENDPVFTYGVYGLEGEDSASQVLGGVLERESGEAPGTYDILQGSLEVLGGNYTIEFTPADFTITAAAVDPGDNPSCRPFNFTAIERIDEHTYLLRLSPGVKGCSYTLYAGTTLQSPDSWIAVSNQVLTADGEFSFQDASSTDEQRFWSVKGVDGNATE